MEQSFPIIFTITNDIICNDFTARVTTHGRALMTLEDGEWWCHGVGPGGLTACGPNPGHAFSQFRGALHGVYADLAEDQRGFESFETAVREFVRSVDDTEEARWSKAREAIRAGGDVPDPFDKLERVSDEVLDSVTVTELVLTDTTQTIRLARAA